MHVVESVHRIILYRIHMDNAQNERGNLQGAAGGGRESLIWSVLTFLHVRVSVQCSILTNQLAEKFRSPCVRRELGIGI